MKKIQLAIKYFINSFNYLYNDRNYTLGQVLKSAYDRAKREIMGDDFKEFLADGFFNNEKKPTIMYIQELKTNNYRQLFDSESKDVNERICHYYKIETDKTAEGFYIIPQTNKVPLEMWGMKSWHKEIAWYD